MIPQSGAHGCAIGIGSGPWAGRNPTVRILCQPASAAPDAVCVGSVGYALDVEGERRRKESPVGNRSGARPSSRVKRLIVAVPSAIGLAGCALGLAGHVRVWHLTSTCRRPRGADRLQMPFMLPTLAATVVNGEVLLGTPARFRGGSCAGRWRAGRERAMPERPLPSEK